MERQELLKGLAQRIDRCAVEGRWQAREIYAAAWLTANAETDRQFQVAGLAKRIAAKQAATPLDERQVVCPGHPAGPADPVGETFYCDGSCARTPRRRGRPLPRQTVADWDDATQIQIEQADR